MTSGGYGKAGSTLASGDIVEVCEGQLMHLQGKVIYVEGDVITIMPKHENLRVYVYTERDRFTCTCTQTYVHTYTYRVTHAYTDT